MFFKYAAFPFKQSEGIKLNRSGIGGDIVGHLINNLCLPMTCV